MPQPPTKKYWGCKVPSGKIVRVEDLPMSVFADIHARTAVPWYRVVDAPANDAKAGIAVYEACCAHVGEQPVELTAAQFIATFDVVDDDLPDTYVDGIPDPKADARATTG